MVVSESVPLVTKNLRYDAFGRGLWSLAWKRFAQGAILQNWLITMNQALSHCDTCCLCLLGDTVMETCPVPLSQGKAHGRAGMWYRCTGSARLQAVGNNACGHMPGFSHEVPADTKDDGRSKIIAQPVPLRDPSHARLVRVLTQRIYRRVPRSEAILSLDCRHASPYPPPLFLPQNAHTPSCFARHPKCPTSQNYL